MMPHSTTADLIDISQQLRSLRECSARVRRLLKANADTDQTLRVAVGSASLRITPLQVQLSSRQAPQQAEAAELVREILAWQVKSLADRESTDAAARGGGTPSLLFDAAIGSRLLTCLDALVARHQGQLYGETRNGLLGLRQDASHLQSEILTLLDDPDDRLAKVLELVDASAPDALAEPRRPRSSAKPSRSGSRRAWKWFVPLALLLAGSASLFWMNASRWSHRPPSGTLQIADFETVPIVRQLEDRPPSVFLVVERDSWSRLPLDARNQVVGGIREIIARRGYVGALLSTRDGAVVAQWTATAGIELFDER